MQKLICDDQITSSFPKRMEHRDVSKKSGEEERVGEYYTIKHTPWLAVIY